MPISQSRIPLPISLSFQMFICITSNLHSWFREQAKQGVAPVKMRTKRVGHSSKRVLIPAHRLLREQMANGVSNAHHINVGSIEKPGEVY